MKLNLSYGLFARPIETQLNEQNLTLGDRADLFHDINRAILTLELNGIATREETNTMFERLHAAVGGSVKHL